MVLIPVQTLKPKSLSFLTDPPFLLFNPFNFHQSFFSPWGKKTNKQTNKWKLKTKKKKSLTRTWMIYKDLIKLSGRRELKANIME